MSAALLYRRRQRWHVCAAFVGAIAIHIVAVAIAENRSQGIAFPDFDRPGVEVEVIANPQESPPQPETPPTLEEPSITKDDETFDEENPTPPPTRLRKPKAVTPIKPLNVGTAASANFSSVRALAINAPRPEYPYEARRQRATGSGIAVLTLNPQVGSVIDVRMLQSTGSAILDNATTSALRRWRFKAGDVTTIHVPITFTLTGAIY